MKQNEFKKLTESIRRLHKPRTLNRRNRRINENYNGMDNERIELFNIIYDSYLDGWLDLFDFTSNNKDGTLHDTTVWASLVKTWALAGAGWEPMTPDFVTAYDVDNAITDGILDPAEVISDMIKIMPINIIKRTMRHMGISSPISESRRPTRSRHINEDKEFNNIMKKAKQGDAEAQYNIGYIYARGWNGTEKNGDEKNSASAVKWYALAAKQGNAEAQYKLGIIYYNGWKVAKNLTKSLKLFTLAAKQGHAEAQGRVGEMYEYGEGAAKSGAEAVKWYTLAAEQGHQQSLYDLVQIYDRGLAGIPKNKAEVEKWWKLFLIAERRGNRHINESVEIDDIIRAAKEGDADAQYQLAIMYVNGDGVPENTKEGVNWYRRAAKQGHIEAQYNLGWAYANGEGAPKNNKEAVKWLTLAAEQGNGSAIWKLKQMKNPENSDQRINESVEIDDIMRYAKKGDVNAQYDLGTAYDISENYQEAVKWYRVAAEQGHVNAQVNIGLMYQLGTAGGIKKNKKEAIKWFTRAAEQGNTFAGQELKQMKNPDRSVLYTDSVRPLGETCRQTRNRRISESIEFDDIIRYAKKGDVDAQLRLGEMYQYEEGVAMDTKKAMKWYRLAAEQGNAEAKCNIGIMYEYGKGVVSDTKKAVKWYRLAAEQGYAEAQYLLGFMYNKGLGVTMNDAEAVKWWRRAAKQGHTNAQNLI